MLVKPKPELKGSELNLLIGRPQASLQINAPVTSCLLAADDNQMNTLHFTSLPYCRETGKALTGASVWFVHSGLYNTTAQYIILASMLKCAHVQHSTLQDVQCESKCKPI